MPRNLLFILFDQQRAECLGYAGHPVIKTPNLDRMAQEGAVFTNAYTPMPVCAPIRQSLFSGKHPDRIPALWNHGFMPTSELTPCGESFAERLKAAGRRCTFIGRWETSHEHSAAEFGYDEHISRSDHEKYVTGKYGRIEYTGSWFGCTDPLPLEDSLTHWIASKACEKIESAGGSPWHIFLDLGMPHLPCRPAEPFASMYSPEDTIPFAGFDDPFINKPFIHSQQPVNWETDKADWKDLAPMAARYYAMISQLDDAVGRIIDCLRRTGAADDTLVVFTADHGDMCGSHRMLDKHYVLYDDVTRIPLMFWGAGVKPASHDMLVSGSVDTVATIDDIFGLGCCRTDGRVLPVCGEGESERDYVSSSANGQQFGMFVQRMITDGRYKYVWNLTDIDELYDVSSDPGELFNLIYDESKAELLARLRLALRDELVEHGDRFFSSWVEKQLTEGRKVHH